MKRCPACDKTFPDSMKFCQTDGTLLIADAAPADPYKTVVGNQSDISSAIPPADPFKTVVGGAPPKTDDEDLLQLPDTNSAPDSMKTMVVSQDELLGELKSLDAPGTAPNYAPSAPLIEPTPPKDSAPKSNEPSLSPPNFGDLSAAPPFPTETNAPPSAAETNFGDATAIMNKDIGKDSAPPSPFDAPKPTASPFDSKPAPDAFSAPSPFGNQENKPIPSPFDGSMIGYQPPAAPPFEAPKPPPFKEPDSPFGNYQDANAASASPPPFQSSSPFDNADPFKQTAPAQNSEWTPPPAPVSEWQNQDLGANTPFQPPGATGGQDQTLAIVSLVCGILGIVCCGLLTGIPAIITGYMAKNNADSNPSQYGGRGLAVAGMIMGGISVLFSILGIIYYIIMIIAATSS